MSRLVRASLVFILIMGLAAAASAQTKIGGGVKAGVNFATVSGDVSDGAGNADKRMRVGGAFGGFVSVPIKEGISFEPEVLYSMEGVKITFTDGGTSFDAKAKVDVVEIPLLIRVASKSSAATKGYFLVGPEVGIIARAKQEVTGQGEEDFKDQLKKADFSIVVGGGVQMSKAFVEARYSAGLTDVNKSGTSATKNRSQVVQVLVGARF